MALAFATPARTLADDPGALRRDPCRRTAPLPGARPHRRRDVGPRLLPVGALVRPGGPNGGGVAWLERATLLEPSDYWSQFYLGNYHERLGQNGRAMEHYQAAVALRPDSPWARCNRAVLYHARGDWDRALDDLNRALASPQGADLLEARLELGVVKQVLGDDAGARAAYESVIAAAEPSNLFARAARLNRAKLDFDAGAVDRAWAEYAALLAEVPRDDPARWNRALLAMRLGRSGRVPRRISRPCSSETPERGRRDPRAPRPGPAGTRSAGRRGGRRRRRLPTQAEPEPRTALGADAARPPPGRGPLLAQSSR